MSDTSITPEERALWASVATARINAVTPERQYEITAQERLVKALIALEQTEAKNARLIKMVDWLVDKLGFNAGQPYYDECPRLCATGKRECLESDGTVCFDYGPCWKARAIKEVMHHGS